MLPPVSHLNMKNFHSIDHTRQEKQLDYSKPKKNSRRQISIYASRSLGRQPGSSIDTSKYKKNINLENIKKHKSVSNVTVASQRKKLNNETSVDIQENENQP